MDNYNYNYKKEIYEAIQAADNALYYLNKANSSLNSAGNWGIVDILGGGLIFTFAKHSKMNDASIQLEYAKKAVQNFKKELMDVTEIEGMNLETGDFISFADYFFDGFIADWLVQSRIRETQRQINDAIAQINGIKLALQSYK